MKHRIDVAFALVALLFASVAAHRWRATAIQPHAAGEVARAPRPIVTFDDGTLDDAAGNVTSRDPFRLSRTPPLVPFASRLSQGNAPAAAPFRPQLALKGIVGGPPWQAVIDGIPGQPAGSVVREGDSFDRLQVRAVSRDSVFIQLPDTVLVLTIKGVR